MKPYVEKLRLKHDPFDGECQRNDFFGGGGRENLLHNVLAGADRQVSLDAVIGPEGSGKTRLAYRFCELSGNDFRPALISVDLFTTAQYLLRALLLKLELDPPGDLNKSLDALSERAIELARSGKSILLVIDNAHELGSDCMKLVERLLASRLSAIRLVLLGEEQLKEMLQARLRERYRAKLAIHDLPTLNRVETAEYIHLKLARAGYGEKLPLSSQAGLDLLQQSAGLPGKINALTAAMLISDEVPAVAGLFVRRRGRESSEENGEKPERPEFRYLWQAFALSLALAVVVFWPVIEPESSASPEAVGVEPRQISLRVPVGPESAGTAQEDASGSTEDAGAVSPSEAPPTAGESPGLSEFERMLLDTPPDSFTVQIIASTSEEGVRGFIAASQLGEIHGYYETRRRRGPWFVVVDGMYPDWETAMEARAQWAGKLDDLEPWIRRISNVHSEIELAGKQGEP
ncbi:MAG: AAA family ATPase [Gammaproteobacteria bacterium]|nr:AAA family ATPase [Gammaproteobacteria bacterium]MYH47247.1 AAA family ATPase [Gammaproteobacteria bacterium]MYL12861.1 AAA family ATPase [Gammaproteobacteria bacterium]